MGVGHSHSHPKLLLCKPSKATETFGSKISPKSFLLPVLEQRELYPNLWINGNLWGDSRMNQGFGAVWAGSSPVSAEIWAPLP